MRPDKKYTCSLWPLRPGDLPDRRLTEITGLAGLEDNAVYRALIFQHHRLRKNRLKLVVGYASAWLLCGTLYFHFILRVRLDLATAYTSGITTVLLITLGNLFLLGGVEGYETNGWLKHYFRDLIQAGTRPAEIARGIVAKTVSHYNLALIRGVLILAGCVLCVAIFYIEKHRGVPLVNWILLGGIFGIFHLASVMNSLSTITIPCILIWYRGVRESYERNLKVRSRSIAGLLSINRTVIFLASSVCVLFIPPLLYLYVGIRLLPHFQSVRDGGERLAILLAAFSIFAIAGLAAGSFWGVLSRRMYRANFRKLTREIEILFKLRAEYFFARHSGEFPDE